MVYLKLFPRPMGPEPQLYFERPPEAVADPVEVEPGYFLQDPWELYDIIEFSSEFLARQWLKNNYPMTYAEMKSLGRRKK
jgi:hypothetical protein